MQRSQLMIVALLLAACHREEPNGVAEGQALGKDAFRELHPEWKPDAAAFTRIGCTQAKAEHPHQSDADAGLDCGQLPLAASLNCGDHVHPLPEGAGLVPPRAIAACWHRESADLKSTPRGHATTPSGVDEPLPKTFISMQQEMEHRRWLRYLTIAGDQLVLISSVEELAEAVAPIDTADEALAFGRLAGRGAAWSSIDEKAGDVEWIRWFPRASHAIARDGRFELRLFRGGGLGCNTLTTAHQVFVDKDGTLTEGATEDIFRTTVCY